jgi:2-polyprenyl-3-methyl-5-hydroxy-6-metoxy-1,4-benzoquinol methylase
MSASPTHPPNPAAIFDSLNAYQQSFALKAAIDLDIFSEIARGSHTADAIAVAVSASPRGIRILCDFLVLHGILTKESGQYALTPDSAMFLDRKSPAYLGGTAGFLLDSRMIAPFLNLTETVRTGKTTLPDEGTVSHDNPVWVPFAKNMAAMMYPAAAEIAALVAGDGERKVLDIAAGHGIFGIIIAKQNPAARITALDWPGVLAVATENAAKHGVSDRHTLLPGDAFEAEYGGPYDLVLVTNFFHHFDQPTCEKLMRKIFAALKPGGRCVTLEFVPNEDRVSPPTPAGFAMIMLGTTPAGDAYTASEYETMFRNSGYQSSEFHPLQKSPETVIVSTKA